MTDADMENALANDLSALVPGFARHVIYSGPAQKTLESALAHHGAPRRVIQHDSTSESRSRDSMGVEQPADCVLLVDYPSRVSRRPLSVQSTLASNGYLILVATRNEGDGMPDRLILGELAAEAGLAIYSTQDCTLQRSGVRATVLWAVPTHYNPLLHARALKQSGRPASALEVLNLIPETLLGDPKVRQKVTVEKLDTLLAWDRASGPNGRLHRFFHAEALFYDAVHRDPNSAEPYRFMAEFWARIGDHAMAARLLRTLGQASTSLFPRPETRSPAIETLNSVDDGSPSDFRSFDWPKRVLFVTHPRPHYGLDVLHDGLCELLGDDNVVEFPFKPALHGAPLTEQANYPCQFFRAGTPRSFEALLSDLEKGRFDVVLYGDIEGHLETPFARRLADAARHLPICLVDAQDDPIDHRTELSVRLGTERFFCYFKREMLSCWDYGPLTVPLPFAYPDNRVPRAIEAARTQGLFWAGHRQFGLRRRYLEHLESKFNLDLSRSFTQDEYSAALRRSRIGLNLFGFGFDTVRYWEVPAHGCMLLAERPPIRIPFNFQDGQSAVFFDDLADLEAKLAHYLEHPDRAAAIALRGHEHLKRFHTASARAAQLLAWVRRFAER